MDEVKPVARVPTVNIGSRVNREVHARFRERPKVRFLRATRQSRQTNTPDEFAACPLYLQLRLYRWTATNRREVPQPAVSRCSNPECYSITSSARASSVGGNSIPSALAALRLSTNRNLVGRCTGRSAGIAPFKICPV